MKKLIALTLAGMMVMTPFTAFAEDANLEARVAALEEKVAALEAQLSGSAPEGVAAAPDAPAVDGIEYDGCRLEYVDNKIIDDCVMLYFDFFNDSDEIRHSTNSFEVSAFQNGVELEDIGLSDDAYYDQRTDLQPGGGPLRVGFAFKIDGHSDIDVRILGFSDILQEHPAEFTVTLE